MESLRPNDQRAKYTLTLIRIVLIAEILSLVSGYFQYDLLETVAAGELISEEAATANDLREQIIAIIYLIVFIISGVTFIQWFRRAYYNLHLKIDYLNHGEGWAAGSWFVPIVNLYRPYQIMKEMYQETKELLNNSSAHVQVEVNTASLGWWWGLWVTSSLIGQFIFRYSMKAETIEELTVLTGVGMINNIIGIPLALITIKVIKDYAMMEAVLHEVEGE